MKEYFKLFNTKDEATLHCYHKNDFLFRQEDIALPSFFVIPSPDGLWAVVDGETYQDMAA
jgi:hypothetical protein